MAIGRGWSAALFALVAFGGVEATAQRPSSWVATSVPGLPSAALAQRGKLGWFVDNGTLHVFSAATRSWSSRQVAASAVFRHANDWLLIEDGRSMVALAAARGRFDEVTVPAGAYVVNSPTGRNDGAAIVTDGTTLWWFSGHVGRWRRRAVEANASFAVQRSTALIVQTDELQALSVPRDAWTRRKISAPIRGSGVADSLAWASDGVSVHAYSAVRERWASARLPVAASFVGAVGDVALWASTSELLAFSGVRGEFARVTTGETVVATVSDHLAYARSADQRRHFCFSAPIAAWQRVTTASPAIDRLAEAVLLLSEPDRVHAFGALHGGVTTIVGASAQNDVAATVAAVRMRGDTHVEMFSAMTQAWHRAPHASTALPMLARNGALSIDDAASVVWAFSARSGGFVARAVQGAATLHGDASSSILAVEDDAALAVFEARRERWLATPIATGDRPLRLAIWRTSLAASTAGTVIGYGAMHGDLEVVPLRSAVVDLRAASESAFVLTGGEVLAFSAVGDLRCDAQFPEFRRMTTRGSSLDLDVSGAPRAEAHVLIGAPDRTAGGALGVGGFSLELATVLPLASLRLDADGFARLRLRIPDDPALLGVELGVQAFVLPAAYWSRLATWHIAAVPTVAVGGVRLG